MKRGLSKNAKKCLTAYAFISLSLVGFLLFTFIPIVMTVGLSFLKWDTANPVKFVGLGNFFRLAKDSSFRIAVGNTLYYTVVTIPVMIFLALVFSVLLNGNYRGRGIYRACWFLPYISSIVAISVIWQFLYQPSYGPINSFLQSMGVANPPAWLSSPQWAMPGLIIMRVWQITGYYIVILLAGLQDIPAQLYEAAKIDGAGALHSFFKITLPMLSPTLFFVSVMSIIYSFKVFDQVFLMTGGGPGRATIVIVSELYRHAFTSFDFGYACSMASVLFAIIFLVTFVQFRAQEKWVDFVT